MFIWIALVYGTALLVPTRHTVTVESAPTGANIKHRGEWLENTPAEVTILWFPGRWLIPPLNTVRLRAPGYRPTQVRIGRGVGRQIALDKTLFWAPTSLKPFEMGHLNRLLGVDPRNTHYIQMMRRHGRSGTWTSEDAERLK
ncbi:MAG: hypothetical protein ACI8RZ_001588 [Myxococcota bacterium]|jgi:hypothetical protein